QIFGRVVLPLTAALVAGVGSGSDVLGSGGLEITDLAYREAMIVPPDTGRLVHLLFQPKAGGDWAYQLNSTAHGTGNADAWRTHVTARVRRVDTNGSRPSTEPTLVEIRKRCSSPADREHYYATLRTDGIDYGPAFQGVQELWSAPGEALGRVVLPEGVASDEHELHPALLDACLHLYPAVAAPARYLSAPSPRKGAGEPSDDSKLYLPITLSGFRSTSRVSGPTDRLPPRSRGCPYAPWDPGSSHPMRPPISTGYTSLRGWSGHPRRFPPSPCRAPLKAPSSVRAPAGSGSSSVTGRAWGMRSPVPSTRRGPNARLCSRAMSWAPRASRTLASRNAVSVR
ncbi:MAG: hypothetical protein E6G66_19425, partial [Actinobacteria bacterium]